MHEGHPSVDPDHIEKMIDEGIRQIGENVDRRVEESNASAERYVAAVGVLERVAARDSAMTTQLDASLRAEAAGQAYEEPQAVVDAAQFVIDQFGNPYVQNHVADIPALAAEAFEKLVQQQYSYFEGK